MANWRDDDHHNDDDGDDVNNPVFIRDEFLDFHDENKKFVIQSSRLWTRFKKRLPPYLIETLIVMTKSDVIIECVALPIVVQIGTGSKTTTKKTVKTRSMQRESLEIIVVSRGIMVEIIRSRGTIG